MGFFSSANDSKGAHLVLDIGSGYVGAAFVRFVSVKGRKVPEIIASAVRPIVVDQNNTFPLFLASAVKALSRALVEIQKTHPHAIKTVHCFFSSPWYMSEIHTAVYQRKTPFVVTKRILDEVYQKEVTEFTGRTLKRYKEAGEEVQRIEQKVTAVHLNGYPVGSALGKRTQCLEMSIYLAVCPQSVLTAVQETVAKIFHVRHIDYHTYMLAAYTVARETLVTVPDFLLIDVGGEVTDVLLVKKDVVSGVASFPYGYHSLYRQIAAQYNLPLGDIETLMSLYVAGTLEERKRTALQRVLQDAQREWLRMFQESLELAQQEPGIPGTIVLSGGGSILSVFEETLQSEDFHRYTLGTDRFSIVPLRSELLRPYVNASPGSAAGASWMIESMFITTILS